MEIFLTFCTVFEAGIKTISMKKFFLLPVLLCICVSASAQEFSQDEGFYIGTLDVPPALSRLNPVIPERHFNLTVPDIFRKNEKREINMLGIVEREKRFQESIAEYETPSFLRERKEGSLQISDNVHLYNRASNYDFYTGKLKNPVYKEMEAHLFNDFYRLNYGRRYPYFTPFIR